MKNSAAAFGFAAAFAAGAFMMWGVDRSGGGLSASAEPHPSASAPTALAPTEGRALNEGAVPVELYVMSQCPYGVQAEAAFKEIVDKFGGDVDFRLEFIGDQTETGELTSMHGPKEVRGDMVQACAMKHSPKWFDMVLCQNKNWKSVDTNWEQCAKDLGMPVDAIRACADGQEGKTLLAASYSKAKEKGAQGSPTIHIGGKDYEGSRRPADMMRAICAAAKGAPPSACAEIPEAPKVNATILSDTRCAECNAKALEGQLKNLIANPNITIVDYGTAEGKKLFDSIKPVELPVVLFDDTVLKDQEVLAAVERGMVEKNGYKVVSVGDWKPQCNDEGGCDLDECKSTMLCRQEIPKRLDLFAMSQCPYGVKGMDAMKEVLENFKKNGEKIEFVIHYIGDGDEGSLQSMHGQAEVDEDIRQICAAEQYGKDLKFMDYIWCRNKDWRTSNWQPCTGASTGIDEAKLKTCVEGDGKKLLAASFKTAKDLGIGASPTWLANNKYKFSGIDAETIKSNLCKYNKLAGCETTLSGMPARDAGAAAAPQPGCGE